MRRNVNLSIMGSWVGLIGAFGCQGSVDSGVVAGNTPGANKQVVVSVGKSSSKQYISHGEILIAGTCTKDPVGYAEFLKDFEREFGESVGGSGGRGCTAFYVPVEKAEHARKALARLADKYDIRFE